MSPIETKAPAQDDSDDEVVVRPPGPNYMTPQCFSALCAERDLLRKVERPRVVQDVADAAAMGDRSENAEYIYGKRRLREIDSRVRFLDGRLDKAQVIDPAKTARRDRVLFGATVVVEGDAGEKKRWTLVGEDEVDAGAGRISHRSPIGAALLGKGCDDEVSVITPAGVRNYAILEIHYP
jgi:transcription elongation factor GreB